MRVVIADQKRHKTKGSTYRVLLAHKTWPEYLRRLQLTEGSELVD